MKDKMTTRSIVAYTISSPHNTPEEHKKGSYLELEVVLELNTKNVFKPTDEPVNGDHKIPQPEFRAPRFETFTDFIQGVANIVNTYEDIAFADFFNILDKEIRKYHYKGCKFFELTENCEFRSQLAEQLDLIKRKSVPVLKADINEVVTVIRHGTYGKNVKQLLEYINSLYREDAREKFLKVLSELKAYGNSASERPMNYLVKIIRDGIRGIIFDHYTNLNINVRRALNKEMAKFLKKIKDAPSSISKTNLFPYKTAVRELGNTAIEYGNLEHYPNIDSTSTADNKDIFLLKASDEKHQEEATKLETSKEENNSQRLSMTYLSKDESSDETVEGNSKELSQERQRKYNAQRYATLYTEDISYNNTQIPDIIYKSYLKSKLVQKMLVEESTGRLPTVQPTTAPRSMSDEDLRRSIAPPMPGEELSIEVFDRDRRKREKALVRRNRIDNRHGTTSNEDTQAEPDKLRKTTPSRINSRDVSDKDLRRSIAPPLPEEELSIDVFDREEKKRQTTVEHGIKDYVKRMRNVQNKVNQLDKVYENNQKSRINVIKNGYKVKNVVDEYEAKQSKNKMREPKRGVKKATSANGQDIESNKEIVKKYDRHAYKLKNKKKATRSDTTKTVKSVNIPVHTSLELLPTAKNNAGSTTVNDNNKIQTNSTSTIIKKVDIATLNVTEEVKQKIIDNNATYEATKDDFTRRYRRVLEFSSPPLYDQPFDDHISRKGLHSVSRVD